MEIPYAFRNFVLTRLLNPFRNESTIPLIACQIVRPALTKNPRILDHMLALFAGAWVALVELPAWAAASSAYMVTFCRQLKYAIRQSIPSRNKWSIFLFHLSNKNVCLSFFSYVFLHHSLCFSLTNSTVSYNLGAIEVRQYTHHGDLAAICTQRISDN